MGRLRCGQKNASCFPSEGHTAVELLHLHADEIWDPTAGRECSLTFAGLAKLICRKHHDLLSGRCRGQVKFIHNDGIQYRCLVSRLVFVPLTSLLSLPMLIFRFPQPFALASSCWSYLSSIPCGAFLKECLWLLLAAPP